jgi:hypothetical protein
MHVAHGPAMDELPVLGVLDQTANFHTAALIHLVAGDDAD